MPDSRSLSRTAMLGHPEIYLTVTTLDHEYVIPEVIHDRDDGIANYVILTITTRPHRASLWEAPIGLTVKTQT